jgi:tRNA threonylcarbamoyladenosine biosynthesis protein TsaB
MSAEHGSILLAIDTSGPVARAALVTAAGQALAAGERSGPRHSATLLPLCHDLLSARGLAPPHAGGPPWGPRFVAQLAAIACGQGPGSFTGLRVGLAVAKGLALAHDLPLLLVSSLHALAADLAVAAPGALLAPCIDAGKGEVYGQLYRQEPAGGCTALCEELRVVPAGYVERIRAQATGEAEVVVGGTGVDRHADTMVAALGAAVRVGFPGPSAAAVARLALPRLLRGERDDLDAAIPSYGRPPDITVKKG